MHYNYNDCMDLVIVCCTCRLTSPSKGSALAQVHPYNTYQTNKDYLAV
jgi:hypothetical protein